jgi:hypothetical protein
MSSSLAAQFKLAALFVRFCAKIVVFGHKMPHTVTGATSGNAACPFIYNFFDCELRGSEGALGLARAPLRTFFVPVRPVAGHAN